MNANLSLGILSFMIWSAFSTWYYVTHIRQFEFGKKAVSESRNVVIEKSRELTDPVTTKEVIKEESTLNHSKNIQFKKNSIELIAPVAFDEFSDSLAEQWADTRIHVNITGYACDLGTKDYNLQLSKKRAEAIAQILSTGKMEISALSYKGESDPLVPNTTESNRMKNRRVNLQFTSQ